MKQEYFFECGSMEQAEKEWGDNNFIIDRVAAYSRQETVINFSESISKWKDI